MKQKALQVKVHDLRIITYFLQMHKKINSQVVQIMMKLE